MRTSQSFDFLFLRCQFPTLMTPLRLRRGGARAANLETNTETNKQAGLLLGELP